MYSIKNKANKQNKINGYPDYLPDNFLTLGKSFYEKFNELFSYKAIYLHPNENNIKDIKKIIEFRLCPNFNHKLYFMNCFNPIDNYKITFIRVCHACNQIFMLSGRYSTKIRYEKAFNFFIKSNKTK